MKKSFVAGGLGALMAVAAFSSARADERWPNWYIGLEGGYAFMSDQDVSGGTAARKMNMQGGYDVGGSIGYMPNTAIPILNAMRYELEVMYHQNDIHSVGFANGRSVSSDAHYGATTYMVNAFYDIPLQSAWSPYVGAGLGDASVNLPTDSNVGNTGSSDNELAYQLMAGIGYSPASIPNTQWTLGYRYLATFTDPRFGGAGSDVKTQYSTNNIEIGAKFKF